MNRREFLSTTTAALAAAAFEPPAWQSRRPSMTPADVDALLARTHVIDALSVDETWNEPDAVFAAFKRSGVTSIHTSLAHQNLAAATRHLKTWEDRFAKFPDKLMKITSAAAFDEARSTGRLGVLLGFQDATIVESDIRNLDTLYQAGARCIQLTYNSRNLLGDGCTERTNAGLSDFGVSVVHRMNELGIVVDLSHCGEATSRDGITFSKVPPAFTHTMCKAIHDHVRAKSDDLIKAISNKGGMTGILTLGYFVGPTADASVDDYLRHVDHAVKVAGIDHVGLASDYSIRGIGTIHTRESWYVPRLTAFKPSYKVRWPPFIAELDQPERFKTVAHGLAKRGYTTGEIEKLVGGNWRRYFGDVLR